MSAEPLPGSWRRQAACRDWDTNQFYRNKEALHPPPDVRTVCEACPVRAACLFEALTGREQGVWGGTTEKQRKILRRRYLRTSCPSCDGDTVPMLDDRQVCVSCGLSWLAKKVRTRAGVTAISGSGAVVESATT